MRRGRTPQVNDEINKKVLLMKRKNDNLSCISCVDFETRF